MDFAYNRRLATGVLALCVLGSVFGLGGNCLVQDRAKVMKVFTQGIDTSLPTRMSMDAYLEKCGDYARVMAEELRLRVDASSADAARAIELAGTIGDGDDLSRRNREYTELSDIVERMYTAVAGAGLSDVDSQDFIRAYRNFKSEAQKLSYDAYHNEAANFNSELSGFPSGLVSRVVGATELEAF